MGETENAKALRKATVDAHLASWIRQFSRGSRPWLGCLGENGEGIARRSGIDQATSSVVARSVLHRDLHWATNEVKQIPKAAIKAVAITKTATRLAIP
jgi:hypothetical protein